MSLNSWALSRDINPRVWLVQNKIQKFPFKYWSRTHLSYQISWTTIHLIQNYDRIWFWAVACHPHGLLLPLKAIIPYFRISWPKYSDFCSCPCYTTCLTEFICSMFLPPCTVWYSIYRTTTNLHNKIHITKQFVIIVTPTCFDTGVPTSGSLWTQTVTCPSLHLRYRSP